MIADEIIDIKTRCPRCGGKLNYARKRSRALRNLPVTLLGCDGECDIFAIRYDTQWIDASSVGMDALQRMFMVRAKAVLSARGDARRGTDSQNFVASAPRGEGPPIRIRR